MVRRPTPREASDLSGPDMAEPFEGLKKGCQMVLDSAPAGFVGHSQTHPFLQRSPPLQETGPLRREGGGSRALADLIDLKMRLMFQVG